VHALKGLLAVGDAVQQRARLGAQAADGDVRPRQRRAELRELVLAVDPPRDDEPPRAVGDEAAQHLLELDERVLEQQAVAAELVAVDVGRRDAGVLEQPADLPGGRGLADAGRPDDEQQRDALRGLGALGGVAAVGGHAVGP
jgi:hypothetical protein